jgi:UDP-N-acetylglucosamine 3-dehydrogenase
MKKIRVAIAGAGAMGRTHAAAYAILPEVEVVGPLSRAALEAQFASLLADDSIDAVDVCVPSAVHAAFVLPALENGKHVFCETPLAHDLEEAQRMARAARGAGKLLQVGLLMRSVAAYRHVKQVADSGLHGRLLSLATWRMSSYLQPDSSSHKPHYGDPALELMTFDFDFVNWVMGRPGRLSVDGAEKITARLDWDDGRHAAVAASGLMPTGTPPTSGFHARFEGAAFELQTVFDGPGPPRTTFSVPVEDRNPYEVELGHFVACICGRADPELLDAERAIEALALSDATKRKLRQ